MKVYFVFDLNVCKLMSNLYVILCVMESYVKVIKKYMIIDTKYKILGYISCLFTFTSFLFKGNFPSYYTLKP